MTALLIWWCLGLFALWLDPPENYNGWSPLKSFLWAATLGPYRLLDLTMDAINTGRLK